MSAGLRLLTGGLYTLVVDAGRPRTRSLGVPVGGAADRVSLTLGNALVGNPPEAAALEIALAGPTLEAMGPVAGVVFGAPFDLVSDRTRLHPGTTFSLCAGERLTIGGTPHGARAYLCVHGGLDVPEVLGSRSGLAPLEAGATLACPAASIGSRFIRVPEELDTLPRGKSPVRLRILPGSQANWFAPGVLEGLVFTLSSASNRMGLRLEGPALALPSREMVSEPVCPGTVQVTREGLPIVLGADGQTIGGYPKVAQVIAADRDRLGQLRPGDRVMFVAVEAEEAEEAYRRRGEALREWRTRLWVMSEDLR